MDHPFSVYPQLLTFIPPIVNRITNGIFSRKLKLGGIVKITAEKNEDGNYTGPFTLTFTGNDGNSFLIESQFLIMTESLIDGDYKVSVINRDTVTEETISISFNKGLINGRYWYYLSSLDEKYFGNKIVIVTSEFINGENMDMFKEVEKMVLEDEEVFIKELDSIKIRGTFCVYNRNWEIIMNVCSQKDIMMVIEGIQENWQKNGYPYNLYI